MLLAILMVASVWGCATETKFEQARVRVGMSRDDLKFYFGEPLRIENAGPDGEYWYYRFVSPENAQVDGAVVHDVVDGSDTVAVSITPGRAKADLPIHVSPDGHVVEPIPEGKILGR